MPNRNAPAAIPCPSCRAPMQTEDFERNDQGTVSVELCFTCAGIWFDHLASVQLAPAAVVTLFKEIHDHQETPRQPVAGRLACPRCADVLTLSYDLCKSGRFSYYRCQHGDGRFTPFFQFLREKQFVRSLTAVELQRVRSLVRQIKCSECGAPIDLEHSSECRYCHAPVSFLDPEAVEKALSMWSSAAERRHQEPTPQALGDALLRIQLRHAEQRAPSAGNLGGLGLASGDHGHRALRTRLDLVALGIHAIGSLLEPRD